MKVILEVGPRNEELIQEILKKKNTLSNEEWEEYCIDNADRGEEFFDALYYTCENAEEMLHE